MRGQVVSVNGIAGVLLCGGLLWCALWSPAQGNPPSTPSKGQDASLLTPAAIDERLTAVEERLAHVRAQLALLPTAAADTTPPAGATAEEWSEHKELLHRLENFYQSHLDALRELREIRQFQADLQEEASRWQGFTTPPPYALDVVEALWNTLRAKDREIEVARAEIDMFERLREAARPALMQSQQALRQLTERLERATAPAEAVRTRWLQKLGELRSRHDEAVFTDYDTEVLLKQEILALRLAERDFLQRQAVTASRTSPLSVADRDAKLASLTAEQQTLEAEMARAIVAEQEAQEGLRSGREKLHQAREQQASNPTVVPSQDIAHLQQQLDTRKAEADAASSALEVWRLLSRANTGLQGMWEQRYQLDHSSSIKALDDALQDAAQYLEFMQQWRFYFRSRLEIVRLQVEEREKQLAAWHAGDESKALAEQALRTYTQREAVLQHAVARANEVEAELRNWHDAMHLRREAASFTERLRGMLAKIASLTAAFWHFELLAVEDKIMVEGREVVGQRSVTLGKIIQVLLILGVGLWLAARVVACGQRLVLGRLAGQESMMLLVLRFINLAVVVGLVVFAFVTVHIPLTVFAFLGGALAIGVGFGAQNILNNFISGLILLVEQPIKLGDIVEVEGIRGRITTIGSRCCQMRRFDGIDMLIPNSSFLEKHVTNWTLSDHHLRFSITVGVAYGSSTQHVLDLLKQAVEDHPRTLGDPTPEVLLTDFGDNAILFRVDYWIDISVEPNWRRVASEIRQHVEKLFTEYGITIAFPQQDVHLDSPAPLKVEVVTHTTADGAGQAVQPA